MLEMTIELIALVGNAGAGSGSGSFAVPLEVSDF